MIGFTVSDVARAVGGELHGEGAGRPVTGLVRDNREVAPGVAFAALPGARADGHLFIPAALDAGAPCCVALRVPDGETRAVITVPDVAQALTKLASACRERIKAPVIGVTGSVGKTTAKEMIAGVLGERFNTLKTEKNFNNELGVPLTLFRVGPEHGAAVVELGISHFGEMALLGSMARPDIAVYTVIGRAHLEFLGDRDGVMHAKGELIGEMPQSGVVVANGDDDKLAALVCGRRKITFGLGSGCDVRAEGLVSLGADGSVCEIVSGDRRIPVRIPAYGRHMVYAALAAAAVGMELGLTDGEIMSGVTRYAPVGGRASIFRANGVTVIDDSYNANPDSTEMAVDSASDLPGRLVCVLGDMLELGGNAAALHREVGEHVKAAGALLITTGELSRSMGGEHFESVDELVSALPELLRKGDNVLVKASNSMRFGRIVDALKTLDVKE